MLVLILKVRVPTPTELTVMLEEEKDPLVNVPAVVEDIVTLEHVLIGELLFKLVIEKLP